MSDFQTTEDAAVHLKQKLLDALKEETLKGGHLNHASFISMKPSELFSARENSLPEKPEQAKLSGASNPGQDWSKYASSPQANGSQENGRAQAQNQAQNSVQWDFDDKLSMRGAIPNKAARPSEFSSGEVSPQAKPSSLQETSVKLESVISGGSMADLSGYKDLSKAPMSFGDEEMPLSSLAPEAPFERPANLGAQQVFAQDLPVQEVDTEFSGNVKTLIRLVNELPEGVTKQTGAQIIRLTMEAMGISMEDVLSEAQSAQSEMLDAVRANIKKIEEYKTVIRKLETDIKYYQGKANELSEIIDLFILSNTSGNKVPGADF